MSFLQGKPFSLFLLVQLIDGLSEVLGSALECNFFQGSALWCVTSGMSKPLLLTIQVSVHCID